MFLSDCRSHFSIGESLLTPTEIIDAAKSIGATSAALTDTMRVTGMVEFMGAAKKAGVTPVIGARLRIVDSLEKSKEAKKKNRPYYLRVIVHTEAGYRALLRLLSMAFQEDHFYEVPRLLLDDVASVFGSAGNDAATVTLGDFYGAYTAGKAGKVIDTLRAASVAVASEIVPIPTPHFARLIKEAHSVKVSHGVPVIVALPFFYKDASQADSLDLLTSIASNIPFSYSPKHFWRQFVPATWKARSNHLKELIALLEKKYPTMSHKEWLSFIVESEMETNALEKRSTFKWDKETPSLPEMAPDEYAELVAQCEKGWKERLSVSVYGHKPMPSDLPAYRERLDYELKVLKDLNFSSYFLLVAEIVNWSKSQDIRVGPARGSVGGSLIAFLMGITDIDPIRFNLLFERFINPDRIDLPDADLDFMSTRREDIITWIKSRFGDDYVAAVANYNTMAAAGALKDTCAKLEVSGNNYAFGKLVPKEHGQPIALADALTTVPELAQFAKDNPTIIAHALNLEDRMRSYGKHAAGIVVAGVPLHERAVVERRDGNAVVNWDKRLVEDFGLVKIDVLGLSTLDVIDIALRHIFRMHGKRINPTDIPLDDPKVLEAFGRGETVGVFQFESGGMRRLLRDLALITPLTFDDVTAATALYRPGPMDSGLMEQFIKVKQGVVPASYPHASMTNALKDTYGVMVYQEEVMQVSRDFAGFTFVQADHLRKAMGKKDKDKMKEFRDKFVDGAVALHGVNPDFAGEIFDQIEKFAGYGFNKSHAAAYSIISMICMWLKTYYPAEFYSGLLTMVADDRRAGILADMKRAGVSLIPPDINDSEDIFSPLNATTVLMPFNAVLGLSEKTARAIMEARGTTRFTSKADFLDRVEKRRCNSKHTGLLDRVGAFSRIESDQLPATDHTRRRDHVELLEGLIDEAVIIDRPGLTFDHFTVPRLEEIINGYRNCEKCSLAKLCHPKPGIEGPARIMVVLDAPSFKEEAADQMGVGSSFNSILEALENAGMSDQDAYVTAFIKSPKPSGGKFGNDTLAQCPAWLEQEIDVLKPPVIVVLGNQAFRHFFKDIKGGMQEQAGRVIYNKDYDCNFLIGINPGAIYHDPSKQQILNDVFLKIPDLMTL